MDTSGSRSHVDEGKLEQALAALPIMASLAAIETMAHKLWPAATHVAVTLPDPRKGEQVVLVTDAAGADRAALLAFAQTEGYPELWVPRAVLR